MKIDIQEYLDQFVGKTIKSSSLPECYKKLEGRKIKDVSITVDSDEAFLEFGFEDELRTYRFYIEKIELE